MLTIEEKIKLIKEIAENNNISSYEIGENTSVSAKTAYNIFNDDKIKPRNKTLNIILEYLENSIVGTESTYELTPETQHLATPQVAEETVDYRLNFKDLKIDDKLNIIHNQQQKTKQQLDIISQALVGLSLKFDKIIAESKIKSQ